MGETLRMFRDIAPKASPNAAFLARKLRKEMTLPEVLLWRELRQRPYNLKFRCQHGTGEYVLDFYCSDARLAVEVDGIAHDNAEQAEHDGNRDAWLSGYGIDTLRVPAREVLADAIQAAEAIVEYARGRLPLHHPAAPGGPPHRASSGRIYPSTTACGGGPPPRDELGEDLPLHHVASRHGPPPRDELGED